MRANGSTAEQTRPIISRASLTVSPKFFNRNFTKRYFSPSCCLDHLFRVHAGLAVACGTLPAGLGRSTARAYSICLLPGISQSCR